MATEKFDIMNWYAGPFNRRHIAELRYKLALLRGFISYLQSETQDGNIDLNSEYLEELLKKTSDP